VTLHPDQRKSPESIYTEEYFERGAQSGYTNYAADEPIHRLNARRHLNRMTRFGARPPGVLLDLGCAAGFFMSEATARGWSVLGVDVSPWSRRYARDRFGFTVFESIDEAREKVPAGVDAITAFQVLEHIPDIRIALESVRSVLKPGGQLFIETWNRSSQTARIVGKNWQQLSPPSVVHLFNTLSLNRLLEGTGFRSAPFTPMTKFLSVAWAAGLVGSKLENVVITRVADSAFLRGIPLPYLLDDLVYLATRSVDAGRAFAAPAGPGGTGVFDAATRTTDS
jgi:SAM-dependent methyltransferase